MAIYTYTYREEVIHEGLNKYRVVTAKSRYELEQKVASIQSQWDEQWRRKCEVEQRRKDAEKQKLDTERAIHLAEEMTKDAENSQRQIENLLQTEIDKLTVEDMYDKSEFTAELPIKPWLKEFSREPLREDAKYNEPMSFFTSISKKKKEAHIQEETDRFNADHKAWKDECSNISEKNASIESKYKKEMEEWELQKEEFHKNQEEFNRSIDEMYLAYQDGDKYATESFFSELLDRIELPLEFENETQCEFNPENKMLIVDITLPTIDNLPNLKKVTYVKSSGEYKESYQSETFMKKMYDKSIYDIVLLTLKAIFISSCENIDSVVLNGKINTIDKSTGKSISPYILSVNISKESFMDLDLEFIDSKEWFKSSRGVSAATFTKMTPIAPVVEMSREDHRFIEGYEVADTLDESVNLGTIDWQDFENLIREIFTEEFNSDGGEVKITQASRDGGVDAVAFDPDPIRGGKICNTGKALYKCCRCFCG